MDRIGKTHESLLLLGEQQIQTVEELVREMNQCVERLFIQVNESSVTV